MADTDKFLKMLESPKTSVRYDACKKLRVAVALSKAEFMALTRALNDPDQQVSEGAAQALSAHKESVLAADDTRIATGGVDRTASIFDTGRAGLLVRSGDGSYYLLGSDTDKKTSIHGVLPEIERATYRRNTRDYIGLVTGASLFYFFPWEIYIAPGPGPISQGKAEYLLEDISASGELPLVRFCRLCNSTRPANEPECSNPDCVKERNSTKESPEQADIAQVSCMVGGTGGLLVGMLLYAIAYITFQIFIPQPDLIARMKHYWYWFPAILGTVGYLGLYTVLLISTRRANR